MSTATAVRVLWLAPHTPDGISEGRSWIASALSARGLSVTQRTATPDAIGALFRNRNDYDVIVGTTRAGAGLGLLGSMFSEGAFVVDHVDPIEQFAATSPWWLAGTVDVVERLAFSRADHVIYHYDRERKRIDRSDSSVTKSRLAIQFDRFASPAETVIERARAHLDEFDTPDRRLVYVGGLEPIYRIETLLEATEKLTDWTLVVLGAGSLEDRVERAAERIDSVVFPGLVDNELLAGYLHACDVGISLVDDPHTLKVLEYGAAGLPVVQVDGRARATFEGQVTFCDPTPESVATAIRRATESGPSDELRKRAADHDIEAVASIYERVIRNCARS
ncbi:glycosyltransferase [Halocatena halophila]|uniref:glycosyltransferase n=1 Tax=Halocatena halophila TaxID=2814576 RepID=UPI002ED3B962